MKSVIIAALALFACSLQAVDTEAAPPRMVFAHYMVCIPTHGGASQLDDYKREIQEARRRGIDGFALNCGNWTKREQYYKTRSSLLFAAAKELGADFKLFFSADGVSPEEAADMVFTFHDHPNQLRHHGKPVLSTFAGSSTWGRNIVELIRAGGKDVVFVPYYYPTPVSETPQREHADQLLRDNPSLDGFFYFGAAGTGERIAASNHVLAEKWLGAGKLFMASVTPHYRGLGGNYRVYETRGFEAMAAEWEGAIKDRASWVEIVTWNDWGEASYVAPFGPPQQVDLWNGHWGPMLSHVAYLDASRYYIAWYKSGKPPAIVQDALYYFYRVHPKTVPGIVKPGDKTEKRGLPGGADRLVDEVFVTLFLTAPAQLEIRSGGMGRTVDLAAGVHHVSTPFASGAQCFILTRNGATLIDKTGEHEISATEAWGNYNYFAGQAVAGSP